MTTTAELWHLVENGWPAAKSVDNRRRMKLMKVLVVSLSVAILIANTLIF